MFRFIRSRLLYAGQIGWLDGRRGYPAENDCVDLPLHGAQALPAGPARDSAPRTPEAPSAALPHPASALAREDAQHLAQA